MVLTVASHGKSRRIYLRVQLDTEVKELAVPIPDSKIKRRPRYFFVANNFTEKSSTGRFQILRFFLSRPLESVELSPKALLVV